MKTPNSVPIHEAKSNLSKLVKRAAAGETIFIGAYGNPEAAIVPLNAVREKKPVYLAFGALKDKLVLPDAWEDNLSEDITDSFYDSQGFGDKNE